MSDPYKIFDFDQYISNDFCYRAKVIACYDADTITCDIDVGFGIILHKRKIRLLGINAPEMRGTEREEGLKSRDYLRGIILGRDIRLYTVKPKRSNIDMHGKYGRLLATVFLNGINMNKKLVDSGFAKYAFY